MSKNEQLSLDDIYIHTLNIDLKDGSGLSYRLNKEAKQLLRATLIESAFDESGSSFIWFYAEGDRLVFIHKKELIRITFLFDFILDDTGKIYCDNFDCLGGDYSWDDEEDNEDEAEKQDENQKSENDDNDASQEESGEDTSNEPAKQEDIWKSKKQIKYLPQLIIKHNGRPGIDINEEGEEYVSFGYFGNPSTYASLSAGDLKGVEIEAEEKSCFVGDYIGYIDDDGEENFMPSENLIVVEVERPLLVTDEELDLLLDRKSKRSRIKKTAKNK